MALLTISDIPKSNIGIMVQKYFDAGANTITVTPNEDGVTCTMEVAAGSKFPKSLRQGNSERMMHAPAKTLQSAG